MGEGPVNTKVREINKTIEVEREKRFFLRKGEKRKKGSKRNE